MSIPSKRGFERYLTGSGVPTGTANEGTIYVDKDSGSLYAFSDGDWVSAGGGGGSSTEHVAFGADATVDQRSIDGSAGVQIVQVREEYNSDFTAVEYTEVFGLHASLTLNPASLSTLGNFGFGRGSAVEVIVPAGNTANFSEIGLMGFGAGSAFHADGVAPTFMYGGAFDVWHDGSQRGNNIIGIGVNPASYNAGVDNIIGIKIAPLFAGSTSGTNINISIQDANAFSGGGLTTNYGLKIENLTTASTNYAIYTGTGDIHFGDDVEISGTIKAAGYKSSDGSAGATAGPFTTITSITVKNGLITAISGS